MIGRMKRWLREHRSFEDTSGAQEYLLLRDQWHLLDGAAGNAQLRKIYFDLIFRLKPDIFCDIGANDGEAALKVRQISPACNVYAFEANPEIYKAHFSRLSKEGIQYVNVAVSDTEEEINLYAPRMLSKTWVDGEIVAASIVEPNATAKASLLRRKEDATYAEFKVQSRSLDAFFHLQDLAIDKHLFALWIDVEGAAAAVLVGAEEVLSSSAIIFIEVENYEFWKGQKKAPYICEFLMRRGFIPLARDQEYGDKQFNILFLKSRHTNILFNDLFSSNSESGKAKLLGTNAEPGRVDEEQADVFAKPFANKKPFRSLGSYLQSQVPIFIPCFNNPTYLRAMIEQLLDVGLQNLVVIDNGSEFPRHLAYLKSIEGTLTVIRERENRGPRYVYENPVYYRLIPKYFCITDPDLELNPNLPSDFLTHLIDLTQTHRVGKAGFSLDISEREKMISEPFEIGQDRCRIWEWEAKFWERPLPSGPQDIAYRASIDTTFALYNKEFFSVANYLDAIRVSGRYTCRYLPWYVDNRVPPDEAAYYRATSKYSFYRGAPPS
jgi:FkbM family methyltransferase